MSFTSDLSQFRQKAIKTTDQTRRAIVLELFNSVVLDSPVDTGRFRGNWQASLGAAVNSEIDRLDPSGREAMADILSNLGTGDVTNWLTNNLPYGEVLELGSSTQAPQGFVRKNVARLQRIINKAARQNKL